MWQEHINKVEKNGSYNISNATVRTFNGVKYVSVGEKAVIKDMEDIGDVVDDLVFDGTGGIAVVKAEVVAVISMEMYASCVNCHGKVLEASREVGQCSKCNTKVKMLKCKNQSVARVVVEEEGGKQHKLTMFGGVVQQIADISKETAGTSGDCNVSDQLVMSPQLTYTINLNKETVCSVARCV